jgi:hypothetical protein
MLCSTSKALNLTSAIQGTALDQQSADITTSALPMTSTHWVQAQRDR